MRALQDEEESVFVSMTDLTVSFLFIVMILLAFFASKFAREDMVPKLGLDQATMQLAAVERRLEDVTASRDRLRVELDGAKAVIAELERSLRLVRDQRLHAEARARSLRRDLDGAQLSLDAANSAVLRLSADIEDAEAEIVILRAQLGDALSEADATQSSLAAARAALAELNARVATLAAENEKLRRLAGRVARDASR